MYKLFIGILHTIRRKPWMAVLFFVVLIGVATWFTSKLRLEEDFYKVFPSDESTKVFSEVLRNSDFLERIVFNIYLEDSLADANPDLLTEVAAELTDSLNSRFIPSYIKEISGFSDDMILMDLYDHFYENLPLYLEEKDYERIDKLMEGDAMEELMQKNYRSLIAPTGMLTRKFLLKDPLSLVGPMLSRMKNLQVDENMEFYNGFLLTKDKNNLLFFASPESSNDTRANENFFKELDELLLLFTGSGVQVDYFGSAAVATANAIRIKKDIQITVSIAILLLLILIILFFRKIKAVFLIFLPIIVGVLSSLAIFALFNNGVSAISLGIGSVLVGITVDFALHILTHAKHTGSAERTLKDVSEPILMSALTTSSAFLCLIFISSKALQDLGVFAAISVVITAIAALIIIPSLLRGKKTLKVNKTSGYRKTVVEKVAAIAFHQKKWFVIALFAVVVFLVAFAGRVEFEGDIEKSNFLTEKLQQASDHLNRITDVNRRSVYIMSAGQSLDEALQFNEKILPRFEEVKDKGFSGKFYGISSLLPSMSKQKDKISRWNSYWSGDKKEELRTKLYSAAGNHNFKLKAFDPFIEKLNQEYLPQNPQSLLKSLNVLLKDFIVHTEDQTMIANIAKVKNPEESELLYRTFESQDSVYVLDKKKLAENLFDLLNKDFNKLVVVSLIVVFSILLLFLGRLETAVVTFIPMLLSWALTLGLMGLLGIKFNIFNIIISTFIFGLGIDYAIFISRGLQLKYSHGRDDLVSFKSSILLSGMTTILGIGVLIFAKHPALQSIAALSIIGIFSVILISFTFQPLLFESLLYYKKKKRKHPVTFLNVFFSFISFTSFAVVSLALTSLIPLFVIFPARHSIKKKVYTRLVSLTCKVLLFISMIVRRKYYDIDNFDLSKPALLISNHQSMIDLLMYIAYSPKILILTKDWVWNNFFMGFIVRYAGFININTGIDNAMENLKKRIEEGYSVLVFPEGTRTKNGKIKRFHKGAFLLAQELELDIIPIMIHGGYEILPKGSFYVQRSTVSMKFLPRIKPSDGVYGEDYNAWTKGIQKYFRKEFETFRKEQESPDYHQKRILANYYYKGPVAEYYSRIKIRVENNYKNFHKLIPADAVITDIGCGMGMMDYMLWMLEPDRRIFAYDYDADKIDLARNCQLANDNVSFVAADIMQENFPESDVILLADMLHYLPDQKKRDLLKKCVSKLKSGGIIIIRDGNSGKEKEHKKTRLTEIFGRYMGFNKMDYPLAFFSDKFLQEFADEHALEMRLAVPARNTSNEIYVFQGK